MIWLNPWAWLGLGAIAIPILIHLLGRDRAPRHSFPSLRFIEIAELPPTRRTRLHDLLLLATRVAVVAIAVAALAQPMLLLRNRRTAIDDRLARAIIVDTSASMSRATPSGGRAIDSARGAARRLASDASTSIVVETSAPESAIGGAVGWLESQPSRRELVVVSDFQIGTIDSAEIATVPPAIGVRAVAIPTSAGVARLEQTSVARSIPVAASLDIGGGATNVLWTLGRRADSATEEPRVEIDGADRSAVAALSSAAKIVGVVEPVDTGSRVTVVFSDAADRDTLARRTTRVTSPRLIDLVARASADPLVGSALNAAEDTASRPHRLLVFSKDSVANVRSAALIGGIRRSLSAAPPIGELDPSMIPESVIASLQRAPSATPARRTVDPANAPSDARWLWMAVLALLGVESWLRRERRAAAIRVEGRAHDRAA